MIPREKFLSTMPQASSVSKWDHRSRLQQMGHVGNLNRREKALHHRKHDPWGWNMGMGTHFKWRIYSLIFMRKRYMALKVFCLQNQLGQFTFSSVIYSSNIVAINSHEHAISYRFLGTHFLRSRAVFTHSHRPHLPASLEFIFPLCGSLQREL